MHSMANQNRNRNLVASPFNPSSMELPPLDLFSPGAGTPPPELAGRDHEKERMRTLILGQLNEDKVPKRAILLHGARGVGKTCLMDLMAKQCEGAGIAKIKMTADAMQSPARAAAHILKARKTQAVGVRRVTGGTAWGFGVTVGRDDSLHSETVLDAIQAKAKDGAFSRMLIVVDEVHALTGDGQKNALQALLQAIQDAMEEGAPPIGLMMAGTPDAYDHLHGINATFVERMIGHGRSSGNLPIGRLDKDAAKQALAQPLAAYGKTIDDDALKAANEATSGYPYFIQMLGEALCEALAQTNHQGKRITLQDLQPALQLLEEGKRKLYNARLRELQKAGAVESALFVVGALESGGVDVDALLDLCAEGLMLRNEQPMREVDDRSGWAETNEDAMMRLLHSGLIWGKQGSESDSFDYGIPSLARHMRNYALKSGRRHLKELAERGQEPDGFTLKAP